MGLLNIFKSKDDSQDIPPPPPLEGLPDFPAPEELEMMEGKKPSSPSSRKKSALPKIMSHEQIAESEERHMHEVETRGAASPIFVEIEEYREMLEEVNALKSSLDDSLDVIKRLETLRHTEDAHYNKWKKQVHELHHKLVFVDHTLFEKNMR